MFPTEIWEKILRYVEAATLVRLRTINSTWNAIIQKHLQESNAWYNQCKNDIPEKYWLILLENSFHLTTLHRYEKTDYEKKQYNYNIWMTMYRAWIKWCNVQNFNVQTINEFNPIPEHRRTEHITCCSVLGELLAVGSTEGYIRIYNLRTNKVVFRVDQYEHVQDVKLCIQGRNYEKIILIATSTYNKSRIWDVTYQKGLTVRSGDGICAGYGYYCTTLNYNGIFVYNATTKNRFPTRLYIQNFNQKLNIHQCTVATNTKCLNMIINKHQLCLLSDAGVYYEFDLRQISQSAYADALYITDYKNIGLPKKQTVRQYYLFNPYVAFCVTDRGHLGISVHKSKWQMYNVFPFLEGMVTAILFYVRVLIIGLNSGDICLYSVENELALRTIDFKSKKFKRIHLGSEPVVSINIMELSGDQRLLIATKSTIYHIKLECDVNY